MAFAAIAGTAIAASYLDAKYGIVRDIKTIMNRSSKILPQVMELNKQGYGSAFFLVEDAARRWPNKEALVFQDRSWTFAQCEQEISKLADWVQSQGLKQNDVVAIYMTNSDLYVFLFFAFAKLGIISSLLNTSLRNETLKYALDLCKPKLAIVSEDLLLNIIGINETPIVEFRFSNKASKNKDDDNHKSNGDTTTRTKRLFLNELPKSDLNSFIRPKIQLSDIMCYFYTSGTTGFPKAVEVAHFGFIYIKFVAPTRPGVYFFDDRRYCPLPFYHASAMALGLVPCWGVGATFITVEKFRASKFWEECRITNATSFQVYQIIVFEFGLQPPSIHDKNHKIRHIYGNGLRSDIWQAFRERFGIELIIEFYGQTDGDVYLENKNYGLFGLGAVAYQGPLLNLLENSHFIVKFDYEKGVPYRDPKTNRCVLAKVNEPGEMIYKMGPNSMSPNYLNIPLKEDPRNLFDVFKKGDFWRRMGDLLVNKDGWYYFVDRVSDTFRWKGENIASQEVAKHLSAYPHVLETIVYGLPLKVYDGQAGMAALVLDPKKQNSIQQTMKELPRFLVERGLPNFAIPRFIRLMNEMPTTVTYKYQIYQLRKEGIARTTCGHDNLFVLDPEQFIYTQLDENFYRKLEIGDAKL
ncbi:6473_t:CDS:10 [Ambispora gerdemannii]|uniref:6473_t:CDS:1 n=1 Tax=Ambispora gerdemannii TaxID=144530 RepID=A0A9N9C2D7_9GLOM|nr:6473_t:CDS:10 [Ambispora gerdemannii]